MPSSPSSDSIDTKIASNFTSPAEERPKRLPTDPMKSLAESVATPLPPFDHKGLIVDPFSEESTRDQIYEQELSARLLDIVLEVQAWAAARPKHESNIAVQRLEKTISDLTEVEKEQGMSSSLDQTVVDRIRQRLKDFVTQITNAVKALI